MDPPSVTPLTKHVYLFIGLHFVLGAANGLIYPIVPFLVRDLTKGTLTQSQISFRSSVLASSFPIGRLVSEIFWGAASDALGTHKTLLITVGAGTILTFWFGVADNYGTLLFIRFVLGCAGGTTSVITAAVREATDVTNRKKAMALSAGCWCLGGMLFSGVGAAYNPAEWTKPYTDWFQTGLFAKHPAALLMTILASLYALSWLGIYYSPTPERQTKHEDTEKPKRGPRQQLVQWNQSLGLVLRQPGLWHMILVFCVIRQMIAVLHELFPLLTSVSRQDPKGFGLGYTAKEVGVANLWMGIFDIGVSFWVIPFLTARYSLISITQTAIGCSIVILLLIPLLSMLLVYPNLLLTVVMSLQAVRAYSTAAGFSVCHTAINMHDATQDAPGAVNGLTLALGNAAQTVATAASGALLGWAQRNKHPFPLNEQLPFLISASLCGIALFSLFRVNIERMPDVLPLGHKQIPPVPAKQDTEEVQIEP
eukprot:TRINITY_DN58391_c0_g1_i1.p1 TRINITY_DN58391_c0_g1~~TRINITY_DN58391_c0_g1_i1.p1  ORF type:complete len:480 (+),score=7.56 TRINITY_DN58391_c0_g1_i1:39-1478(+)